MFGKRSGFRKTCDQRRRNPPEGNSPASLRRFDPMKHQTDPLPNILSGFGVEVARNHGTLLWISWLALDNFARQIRHDCSLCYFVGAAISWGLGFTADGGKAREAAGAGPWRRRKCVRD